jgi:hypothetical protein
MNGVGGGGYTAGADEGGGCHPVRCRRVLGGVPLPGIPLEVPVRGDKGEAAAGRGGGASWVLRIVPKSDDSARLSFVGDSSVGARALRLRHRSISTMSIRSTTPPTTPPMIAPKSLLQSSNFN